MRTNRTCRSRHCWTSWDSVSPSKRRGASRTGERRYRFWRTWNLTLAGFLVFFSLFAQATTKPTKIDAELRQVLRKAVVQATSFDDRFDAEVWLVDMSTRIAGYVIDAKERLHILRTAHREANRAQLPVDLVLAVIHTESHFQRYAISRAGAQGLMQIMPFWKQEIGRPDDNLTDIDTNLRYGCTILSYYLRQSRGNLSEALARYNGSLGRRIYPEKVFKNQLRYEE